MVTPNPVGFRLAEAERFGPSAGDQILLAACGACLLPQRCRTGAQEPTSDEAVEIKEKLPACTLVHVH